MTPEIWKLEKRLCYGEIILKMFAKGMKQDMKLQQYQHFTFITLLLEIIMS